LALSVGVLGGLVAVQMFTLIVITGPTGSGKTDVAVSVAKELG